MIGYAVTVTMMDCQCVTGSVHSYKDDESDSLTAGLDGDDDMNYGNQEL